METKSLALGAAGALLLGGLAFGLVSTANAENQPAPAPSTVAVVETVAPSPAPEPVVSETAAPEPVAAEPASVEPAPVVADPAPVYVGPAPAPVYVEPAPAAPAPQQTYIATNTDAKVAVDANGYVLGGSAPKTGGDGPAKVDMPSK